MQFDISPALQHYDLSLVRSAAVQDIRNLIDFDKDATDACANEELIRKLKNLRPVERAMMLVKDIFGIDVVFTEYFEAVITTQALIDAALANEGVVEDTEMALMAAQKRCKDFMNRPENKCMFVKAERTSADTVTIARDVGLGEDTKVSVTTEGKLKKGEKERIAIELYQNFVKTAADPNDNQAFIKLLMEKLGMTKAGATTYNYNMKKKMGGVIKAKPKRAK